MKRNKKFQLLFFFFPALKDHFESQEVLISQLKQKNDELIAEKESVEDLARTKSDFLSTMSHEIRTQLNAISGMTYFLGEENPRPDQQKHIDILKFASESLRTLVNDILDFNKISAGKVVFEYLDFSIGDLQNVVLESVRQKALNNSVMLNAKVDQRIPDYVIGDPVRLGQVLTNLMSNAVKFTKNGNVDFSAKWVREDDHSIFIRFAVEDNGIGIEKNKLKEIFNAFTQASSETTRIYGGTGLGLTISKKLLELQNSELEVQSQLGVGSTFSFTMEFKKSNRARQKAYGSSSPFIGNPLEGVRLLLAEDNRINQMVAKKFLTKWGINFDIVEDGMAALTKIERNHYDIILMDIQMPLVDGLSVTRKVRKMEGKGLDDLPIIALTASAMIEERNKVIEAGMNDYVPKPFNPDQLFKAIKQQLENVHSEI